MTIREDKMGQSWLLPPDISELIPVDHICYLVIAIVNGIDVSEIEEKSSPMTLHRIALTTRS